MRNGEACGRAIFFAVLIAATAALTAGCGAKHSVGDTVVHDPEADEQVASADNGQETKGSEQADDGSTEATKPEPQTGQFLEAKGASVGDEDWVAEIRGEGEGLWLASPFDAAATYAMVRAATYLQGLRLAEEDFDRQRFRTTYGYKAGTDDGGAISMAARIFSKSFAKDARYRFRVAVDPRDGGGSRVEVAQYREVMEEQPHQDVGDWVEADEPDPAITRKYLEGVQGALGE